MTREEEIGLLIKEQERDDNARTVYPEPGHPRGVSIISLDRKLSDDPGDTLADRICGVEYDFDRGDDVGQVVTFIGANDIQHGHSLPQREHGTHNGYKNQGCRCPRCRKAWADYIRIATRRRRKLIYDARPDRVCANESCQKAFRPKPINKIYCSHRCGDAVSKRRQRARKVAA